MPYITREFSGGARPEPGDRLPESDSAPMTIAKTAELPTGTPAEVAFRVLTRAVAEQSLLNSDVDRAYDQGYLTDSAVREYRSSMGKSDTAKLVDAAEQAVKDRQAQAQQKYNELVGRRVEGDAAAEIRAERLISQVRRKVEAADTPGAKIAVAQSELTNANRDQRGLLADELSAVFAGKDTSWIEKTIRDADPELAAAATDLKRASQSAQLVGFAAGQVRRGWVSGTPPSTIGSLASAIGKYDPDAPQ
jgi:hypothetical protein